MSIERRLSHLENDGDDQLLYGMPWIPDGVLTVRDLRDVLRRIDGSTRGALPSEVNSASYRDKSIS